MSLRPSRRVLDVTVQVMIILLALRLFIPAAALSFLPGPIAAFRQSGLPDWVRWALAVPEMVGCFLLVAESAFTWGVILLSLDLCGAIAVHVYVGANPWILCVFLGLLSILAVARGWLRRHPSP